MISTTTTIPSESSALSRNDACFSGEPVTSDGLTRGQVIERIMTMNPTAGVDFLADFSERSLRAYLDHLASAQIPRGRMARWVRPGDTPGIVMAEPRD
jgi:hypothetical protein